MLTLHTSDCEYMTHNVLMSGRPDPVRLVSTLRDHASSSTSLIPYRLDHTLRFTVGDVSTALYSKTVLAMGPAAISGNELIGDSLPFTIPPHTLIKSAIMSLARPTWTINSPRTGFRHPNCRASATRFGQPRIQPHPHSRHWESLWSMSTFPPPLRPWFPS